MLAAKIRSVVEEAYACHFFELINESHMHASASATTESHFRLVLVSDDFVGMSKLQRHSALNALLQFAFDAGLHALSLKLYTLMEWEEKGQRSPSSPNCVNRKK